MKRLREYFEKYESSCWTLLVAILSPAIPVSKLFFHSANSNVDTAFWAFVCSLASYVVNSRSTIVVRFEKGRHWDDRFAEIPINLSEGKAARFKIRIKIDGLKERVLNKHTLIFVYPKDITIGVNCNLDRFVDIDNHKIVIPLNEIGNNEAEFNFVVSPQNQIADAGYKSMECSSDFKLKSVKVENRIVFYWE